MTDQKNRETIMSPEEVALVLSNWKTLESMRFAPVHAALSAAGLPDSAFYSLKYQGNPIPTVKWGRKHLVDVPRFLEMLAANPSDQSIYQ